MNRTAISALFVSLWFTGFWACGPSSSPPPCYDPANPLGDGITSRQGLPCTQQCECNNQRYEGYCNTQGSCELWFRKSCPQKGVTRICTLHTSRIQGHCTKGIQTCWPEGLTEARWGNCEPIPMAPENTKERCLDHKDNDCDGKIDREQTSCLKFCVPGEKRTCFTIPSTHRYQGQCIGGFQTCDETTNTWKSECQEEPKPAPEICNGKDDNCNGLVDEELPNCSCPQEGRKESCFTDPINKQPQGICAAGVRECLLTSRGTLQWSPCHGEIRPQPEVCNGKDDNCNGTIDEGCETDCSETQPQPETCNNKDDDCDGHIDENLYRPCSTPCGDGQEHCKSGQWTGCTAAQPQIEICNHQDDDCNGKIDDIAPRPCTTSCGVGTETCEQGQWAKCTAPQPQPEICNNRDDDCNGKIDDIAPRSCSTPCGSGNSHCEQGQWSSCQPLQALSEICNNQDDNCNGLVDEGLQRTCLNTCGHGTETCRAGTWEGCTTPQPQPEICNNLDDDCDGLIDNGVSRVCQSPCGDGQEQCVAGQWGSCLAPIPQPESCNNRDDDCNGKIDDLSPRPCATSCGVGTETCEQGQWVKCTAPQPQPETCNNRDDDCNGKIDDIAPRPCKNSCGMGKETCTQGTWEHCDAPSPQVEICNGKDDDCDGKIDNQLTDLGQPCTASGHQGQCRQGTVSSCNAGQPVCQPGSAKTEVCNGEDDDCNGLIDENTKDCVITLVGTGLVGTKDGSALQAELSLPRGLAFELDTSKQPKSLLIVTLLHDRIRRFDLKTSMVSTLTGSTKGFRDGTLSQALFNAPEDIAGPDNQGAYYVADQFNNRIRRINIAQNQVSTGAGDGRYGDRNDSYYYARFAGPIGVAMMDGLSVLISDRGNQRIRLLDLWYGATSTLAGTWQAGYQDGSALRANFNNPGGICYDAPRKIIYIADTSNHRIRKLANGIVSTVVGDGQNGFKDGSALQAQLSYPQGVGVDLKGNVYIADTGNHRIRKYDPLTGQVSTFIGSGIPGKKNGPLTQAQLQHPSRVLIDSAGNGYIADTSNHLIRKWIVSP